MALNGIILINKARGVSSNSVVTKVQRLLNVKTAGHLGTLDVLGEGLLPIALGKGTKLFDYFLNKDKIYKTVFKFGETTATLDLEGEITQSNEVDISLNDVKTAAEKFVGKQNQMPPAYSAKKINGQKAYDIARVGQEVNLHPKEIEIYSIKVLKKLDKNVFELEVHCSSGTYIRSLCRDIAKELSTYGVMLSIQRTKCGNFYINNSFTIQDVENDKYEIIPLDEVFDFETIKVDEISEQMLLNGVKIKSNKKDSLLKVFGKSGFLGVGEVSDEKLKLKLRLI